MLHLETLEDRTCPDGTPTPIVYDVQALTDSILGYTTAPQMCLPSWQVVQPPTVATIWMPYITSQGTVYCASNGMVVIPAGAFQQQAPVFIMPTADNPLIIPCPIQ